MRFTSANAPPKERRLRFSRRTALIFAIVVSAGTLAGTAGAHQWGSWHWHRGGSAVYIYVYNQCVYRYWECEYARRDIHQRPHPVYLSPVSYHTDISVLDCYCGYTGWAGLAQIMNYSGSHILHAHATLNMTYAQGYSSAYNQGIMCQEIGHTLGLTHDNLGSCMGLGYYSGQNTCFGTTGAPPGCNYVYSHWAADLYNMYRYHV
jgi:hypothetical protein